MSERIAIVDVSVVGGVSLLYVVFEVLHVPKRWSFATVGLALLVFAVYLARHRSHSWRSLGFRSDNLVAGLIPFGLCTILAAGGLVLWAAARGGVVWGREVLVLLALYPVSAVVQQLAFQGLLHRGLMVLLPSRVLQVVVTAVAFACVHFGNPTLVANPRRGHPLVGPLPAVPEHLASRGVAYGLSGAGIPSGSRGRALIQAVIRDHLTRRRSGLATLAAKLHSLGALCDVIATEREEAFLDLHDTF